ncbi:hypothetical protein B4U79_04739 [Dinothrombium tinctorium]|uniref:Uncharacterized protein n=1 Tax=Dinothrombium tinctorium TaxID=1965070 RepID=A0A3S3PZ79_9ACAR|nr:hypothetical protein B4U79_04739 [Dinothrombium tinctorium]
MHSKLILEMNT